MYYLLFFISIILSFLCSCNDALVNNTGATSGYYNVDSLLNSHRQRIVSNAPEAEVTAAINGEETTKKIKLDSSRWEKIYTVLQKASIHQPALRGEYNVSRETINTERLVKYKAKDSESAQVDSLFVTFNNKTNKPTYINAYLVNNNLLYSTSKHIQINLDPRKDLISSYKIAGTWDIILKGEESFSRSTTIQWEAITGIDP